MRTLLCYAERKTPDRRSPCSHTEKHIATILFQTPAGKIQRYDLFAPELLQVRKTGIFST